MRTRTVLIVLAVAGALALLVAVSRSGPAGRPSDTGTPESWAVPLDPARVVQIGLVRGDRTVSSVERAAGGVEDWTLRWTDGGDNTMRTWPADDSRVRAALRLLISTPIAVTPGVEPPEPGATVRIAESDGRSVELGFDERSAGGQTAAFAQTRDPNGIVEKRVVGRVPSALAAAFTRTPWTEWRSRTLIDIPPTAVRSLTVESGSRRVRINRGPRGWSIAEPFVLDADGAELDRVLGTIAGLTATGFENAPLPDDATGLDRPVATIIESTDAGATTLVVGRGSDAGGAGVFARVRSEDREAVVRVSPEQFAQITAAPEAYARRVPLGIAGTDIAQVRYFALDGRARLDARRTASGGWTIDGKPASPDQRDAVERVVRVLTSEPAAGLTYQPTPDAMRGVLGEVRCYTAEGAPVASVRLRVEDGLRLVVSQPAGEGMELAWQCASENAKGVALWASGLANGG